MIALVVIPNMEPLLERVPVLVEYIGLTVITGYSRKCYRQILENVGFVDVISCMLTIYCKRYIHSKDSAMRYRHCTGTDGAWVKNTLICYQIWYNQ